MKAQRAADAKKFEDIPNVGPRIARDFRTLGFSRPMDLKGKDPFMFYKKLCTKTKTRHDPCLLDVFMSVTDFMNGGIVRDWWYYTPKRKKLHPTI
ncbi:MAG: helix-hairpin-helix domain-containing protein [Patescibacteria group bacterium]